MSASSTVTFQQRHPFSDHVRSTGCFWAVLRKRGLILNDCGFERDDILIECGHETAMFSGRTIYVVGLLQLGLHPQLVAERVHELPILETYLPEARYVGEVGLDAGPRFYRSLDQQKQVFERILTLCAQHGGKILTVHSVRAVPAVLYMIETHLPPTRGRVVLHWFTGTRSEARRAVNLGCYFSVNGEMLRSSRHREMLAALPVDRLLTETDGPFVRINGRIVRPSDVAATLRDLALLRGISVVEMSAAIRANLQILNAV